MQVTVKTLENKEAGKVDLKDSIFAVEPRADILHRVVNWQLAKRQAGTHSTKRIQDIRGTSAKPHKQKGTGKARQGSLRSPQMRGGATMHGPLPRSHAYSLPKKVRVLGLKMALSEKQKSGDLIVVDSLDVKGSKTKSLTNTLNASGITSLLVIDGSEVTQSFAKAASNIANIDVLPIQGANVYDIMRREKLMLTKEALAALEARFSEDKK